MTGKDYIPNEYRVLDDFTWELAENGTHKLYCDLQNQDCSGVMYFFKVANSLDEELIDVRVIGNDDNTFTFDKSYSFVFCYGKEVDDFHTLDKNQIFAVATSALQEVDKQLQAEKTKVALLESKIDAFESRLLALENPI
jgi:hypothetical protein